MNHQSLIEEKVSEFEKKFPFTWHNENHESVDAAKWKHQEYVDFVRSALTDVALKVTEECKKATPEELYMM